MAEKKVADEGDEPERRREFGSVVRRGKSYVARWWDQRGVRRDKRHASKALARRFLDLKAEEYAKAEYLGVIAVDSVTFDALLDRYETLFSGLKSPPTISSEKATLTTKALPFFTGRNVETITRSDVEKFLNLRAEKDEAGPATRNRTLSMLSALFKRAVRLNHARENPCAGIQRSRESVREPRFLTLEDQDKVIAECHPALRPAVALLLDTGLRTAELLRLQWADFDAAGGYLTVRVSKSKAPRKVPITFRGRAALAEHRKSLPEGGGMADRIFRDLAASRSNGEPCFSGWALGQWMRVRVAAKFPGLRIHDLRHSFAATAVQAGVPLSDLQRLLGHKTMAMTMRYGGHAPANAADLARDRVEALHRGAASHAAVAQ